MSQAAYLAKMYGDGGGSNSSSEKKQKKKKKSSKGAVAVVPRSRIVDDDADMPPPAYVADSKVDFDADPSAADVSYRQRLAERRNFKCVPLAFCRNGATRELWWSMRRSSIPR